MDNAALQMAYSVLDPEGKGEITFNGLDSLLNQLGQNVKPKDLEAFFQTAQEIASKQGVKGKSKAETKNADTSDKKKKSKKKGDEEDRIDYDEDEGKPSLDWESFNAIMSTPIQEEEVKKVFRILDNGTGTISLSDVTQIMEVLTDNAEKMNDTQLQSLLSLAEIKDKEKITFQQFLKWWQ